MAISDEKMRQNYEMHLRKVYYRLEHIPNFRVLYLDYPAVVEDPRREAKRIAEFLGRQSQYRSDGGRSGSKSLSQSSAGRRSCLGSHADASFCCWRGSLVSHCRTCLSRARRWIHDRLHVFRPLRGNRFRVRCASHMAISLGDQDESFVRNGRKRRALSA